MNIGAKRIPAGITAILVQVAPIVYSQTLAPKPVAFDYGRAFFLFLAWSIPASIIAGVIIGASSVQRISQLPKGMVPLLLVAGLTFFLQFMNGVGEVSFYMSILWGISQAPASILGTAVGAYFFNDLQTQTS